MLNSTEPSLKREIGAGALALNAINLTVGAGIFVLPAIVANILGPASFLAYIVCGILVVLIMLCFAEAGSKVTDHGGAYVYVEKAFGKLPGFLINTLFWFGFCCLSDAAVINAMADMLANWFPSFQNSNIRISFFIIVFGSLALVNILGVKEGLHLALAATVLKILPLLLLIVTGIFHLDTANLSIKNWPGLKEIGEASLVLFFAFVGIETALNNSGEIKNPQKNIPKGILMGVAGVVLVYLMIQFICQGVMGDELVKRMDAPLAATASKLIGPVGSTIILITGVISIFGVISGDVLASPRILFGAARDKMLPPFLGKVHPKFSTPYWSIIVYSSVGLAFACSGGFKQLAVLSSSSVLIIYLAVAMATIRLRFIKTGNEQGSFTLPGGILIPVLSIITISWFLSHITRAEVQGFVIFFLLTTLLFFVAKGFQRTNTNPGDAPIKKVD